MTCPVCNARFRGSKDCSRCGADLTMVMTTVAAAWRLRESARQALAAGDIAGMLDLAAQAQQIYATGPGKKLEELAGWLRL